MSSPASKRRSNSSAEISLGGFSIISCNILMAGTRKKFQTTRSSTRPTLPQNQYRACFVILTLSRVLLNFNKQMVKVLGHLSSQQAKGELPGKTRLISPPSGKRSRNNYRKNLPLHAAWTGCG
jgi:hypothetical protein